MTLAEWVVVSITVAAFTAYAVEMAMWPCGRCHRRILPWVKSCSSCLEKMARRFGG